MANTGIGPGLWVIRKKAVKSEEPPFEILTSTVKREPKNEFYVGYECTIVQLPGDRWRGHIVDRRFVPIVEVAYVNHKKELEENDLEATLLADHRATRSSIKVAFDQFMNVFYVHSVLPINYPYIMQLEEFLRGLEVREDGSGGLKAKTQNSSYFLKRQKNLLIIQTPVDVECYGIKLVKTRIIVTNPPHIEPHTRSRPESTTQSFNDHVYQRVCASYREIAHLLIR